jgi:hypothetical protein
MCGFFVVSGLAPRWAAQQPQYIQRVPPDRTQSQVLEPLRAPARGKPAHHKKPAHHWKPVNQKMQAKKRPEPVGAFLLPLDQNINQW